MKTYIRNLVSCLLLVIVSLPLIIGLALHVLQVYHQHKQAVELNKKQQVTIKIPVYQLVWERSGKELLIAGRHFDVISKTIVDGIAVLKGHFDGRDDLFSLLSNQLSRRYPIRSSQPALIQLQWMTIFISLPHNSLFELDVPEPFFAKHGEWMSILFSANFFEVPGAPPWC